jgi:hypothetical protein
LNSEGGGLKSEEAFSQFSKLKFILRDVKFRDPEKGTSIRLHFLPVTKKIMYPCSHDLNHFPFPWSSSGSQESQFLDVYILTLKMEAE